MYTASCESPVGELLLASDGKSLTGLWLAGQKYYAAGMGENAVSDHTLPVFYHAKRWLDDYFAGKQPAIDRLSLAPQGSEFRRRIYQLLCEVPYGTLTTYGQLAKDYEAKFGQKTSARAVGGAVGRNPISIVIPCHRVVGANGAITGYAGGLDKKRLLLAHEGIVGY